MRSPAAENLAKCTCLMLMESAGIPKRLAEQTWADDVEGRKVFYAFAETHASLILAEGKR